MIYHLQKDIAGDGKPSCNSATCDLSQHAGRHREHTRHDACVAQHGNHTAGLLQSLLQVEHLQNKPRQLTLALLHRAIQPLAASHEVQQPTAGNNCGQAKQRHEGGRARGAPCHCISHLQGKGEGGGPASMVGWVCMPCWTAESQRTWLVIRRHLCMSLCLAFPMLAPCRVPERAPSVHHDTSGPIHSSV